MISHFWVPLGDMTKALGSQTNGNPSNGANDLHVGYISLGLSADIAPPPGSVVTEPELFEGGFQVVADFFGNHVSYFSPLGYSTRSWRAMRAERRWGEVQSQAWEEGFGVRYDY